jgi:uncharacterized protein YchJ
MNFRAFTLQANKRLNIIKLQVGIAETLSSGKEPNQEAIKTFWAVLDTGATRSCISSNIVKILQLEPVQNINVHTASGIVTKPSYIVDVFLPNNIRVTPIKATEIMPNTHVGFDCVIGMDILSQGDSSLSNVDGKTMFSFRVPSMGAIDFVKESQNQVQTNNSKKPQKINVVSANRNKMCHCGSGKKFKNCCG